MQLIRLVIVQKFYLNVLNIRPEIKKEKKMNLGDRSCHSKRRKTEKSLPFKTYWSRNRTTRKFLQLIRFILDYYELILKKIILFYRCGVYVLKEMKPFIVLCIDMWYQRVTQSQCILTYSSEFSLVCWKVEKLEPFRKDYIRIYT